MSTMAHVENIVLICVAGALAWFVSPWCLLILLFCNTPIAGKENDND
jgi:hypothetical protein